MGGVRQRWPIWGRTMSDEAEPKELPADAWRTPWPLSPLSWHSGELPPAAPERKLTVTELFLLSIGRRP
jgi:hypothetical protein